MAVVVNLVGGLLLMGPMEQGGLALATSLAAAMNFLILFVLLIRRLEIFPLADFVTSLGKITAASASMCVPLLYGQLYGEWGKGFTSLNLVVLTACIAAGLIIFAAVAYLLRCRELLALWSNVRGVWK